MIREDGSSGIADIILVEESQKKMHDRYDAGLICDDILLRCANIAEWEMNRAEEGNVRHCSIGLMIAGRCS